MTANEKIRDEVATLTAVIEELRAEVASLRLVATLRNCHSHCCHYTYTYYPATYPAAANPLPIITYNGVVQ